MDIKGPRMHGSIQRALNTAVISHRREHFVWDVVNVRIPPTNSTEASAQQIARISESWQSYDVGAEVLVGTFDDEGMALLYYLGRIPDLEGLVHLYQFPGHTAIGSGCYNASVWLNYRRQRLGLNIAQSALHAYEASEFAASSPTVNKDVEILIATANKAFHLSRESPSDPECMVSLPWLRSMARKHAPRKTDSLGFGGLGT
jgi:hypothetical protein